MSTAWSHWERREAGPADAEHTVLLLPGGMGGAAQYDEVLAEPDLAGVRLVAVTLPGHAGTPEPADISVENYARLIGECVAGLGCDVVVGFSMGANYALEMAASGRFHGPLILLAPSFSRRDEALFMRILDQLGRVLGSLPFAALLKLMGPAMKQVPVTPERRDELIAEVRKSPPAVFQRCIHVYLKYLDKHGSVARRLCESGVSAWIVHGERGDGGITDDERRVFEACDQTSVITIPGTSYFTPTEEPALVAKLIKEAFDRIA
jgi:pimeloyl-ACP methyl ester carboxylesterase